MENHTELTAAALAVELRKKGHDTEFITQTLRDNGIDEPTIQKVMSAVEHYESEEIKEGARKDMLYGALWGIGGVVVTVLGYSAASGGGRYMVFYGAIIYGIIRFVRGAAKING